MKKFLLFLLILILILLLYCFFFRKGGCFCRTEGNPPYTKTHWINWNVLFTPNSVASSSQIIQDFKDSLTKYVQGIDPTASLTFDIHYCPCDSLLTNMDATLVSGSGTIVNPPPTKPTPGPSGDYTLANNLFTSMIELEDTDYTVRDTNNIPNQSPYPLIAWKSGPLQNKTLAVIDTGLDTLLSHFIFRNTIWAGNLLWSDPFKSTLYNVVLGEPNSALLDDNKVKHGTAATFIALKQMLLNNVPADQLPKIMSIRAFDKEEKGSIYTVTCAMSYAIQHKVDYINASWGYFGGQDPVLKRYVYMADSASIRIIAAAGNSPIVHKSTSVCTGPPPNELNNLDRLESQDSLFYPACFAPEFTNVVSVTQLNSSTSPILPCYYQNYSSRYITIGATETSPQDNICCSFDLPILTGPIEGSSFATPAVTGILMPQVSKTQNIKSFIESHYAPAAPTTTGPPPKFYTNKGDVITFSEH